MRSARVIAGTGVQIAPSRCVGGAGAERGGADRPRNHGSTRSAVPHRRGRRTTSIPATFVPCAHTVDRARSCKATCTSGGHLPFWESEITPHAPQRRRDHTRTVRGERENRTRTTKPWATRSLLTEGNTECNVDRTNGLPTSTNGRGADREREPFRQHGVRTIDTPHLPTRVSGPPSPPRDTHTPDKPPYR